MIVMSKAAKIIIMLIISEVLYGIWSAFHSSWSVVVFLLAGLGGEIVFLGLWIEKEANDDEIKVHLSNFCGDNRLSKLKSKIGWWILMFGIGFEVLTVTGLAIKDDWQARKAKQEEIKNKPRALTQAEIRAFESVINLIPNKPPVRIFLNEQVSDAQNFGIQLAGVFSESGFKFDGFTEGENSSGRHGVFVGEYGETNSASKEIVSVLKQLGFSAETNEGAEFFPKEIFVDIEPK